MARDSGTHTLAAAAGAAASFVACAAIETCAREPAEPRCIADISRLAEPRPFDSANFDEAAIGPTVAVDTAVDAARRAADRRRVPARGPAADCERGEPGDEPGVDTRY